MANTDQNFLLSDLIADVQSSESLNELFQLYEKALVANGQDSIGVIIPRLVTRAPFIEKRYNSLESQNETTREQSETTMLNLKSVMESITALKQLTSSSNYESKFVQQLESTYNAVIKFDKAFTSLFNALVDHVLKVIEIEPKKLIDKLDIINETINKGINDQGLTIQNLKSINADLEAYLQSITWSALREQLATNVQAYLEVDSEVVKTTQQIIKMKASNPLISDDLVNDANNLASQSNDLLKAMRALINLVYISQDYQQDLIEAISCFMIIMGRLMKGDSSKGKKAEASAAS